MKPDWDKLMGEFPDSVFDVDCTAAGEPLCSQNGVKGYPTIKHGEIGNLQDYSGARSFDALKAFAEANLGPSCGPANLDLCDGSAKTKLEEYMAMDPKKLQTKMDKIVSKYEEDCDMDEDECSESEISAYKELVPHMKKVVAHNTKTGGREEL